MIIDTLVGRLFEIGKRCFFRSQYAGYRKRYRLHDTVGFTGDDVLLYGDGEIEIGEGSYLGIHTQIQASKGCRVVVGRHVAIAGFVRIYTENKVAQDFEGNALPTRTGDVRIGDYAWIGTDVFIREGVTIGENAVIGANSVVISDVPPFTVAAGCPARVVRDISRRSPHAARTRAAPALLPRK